MKFRDKLQRAAQHGALCVGLDPVPERLPDPVRERRQAVSLFLEEIVRATAPWAAGFKPNMAFFEALGPAGDEALGRAIDAVRRYAPEALLIGDGKRGDIGSTAERYAAAMFDVWGFDAATVNPYFGADGVLPFLQRPKHGAYLLAATSNPSAAQIQAEGARPLPLRIANLAAREWNEQENVGLVVGATRAEQMAAIRAEGPELPWLLPGIGAQGGDLEAALEQGDRPEAPAMINSSRGILYASSGEDFAEAAAAEARALHEAISTNRG